MPKNLSRLNFLKLSGLAGFSVSGGLRNPVWDLKDEKETDKRTERVSEQKDWQSDPEWIRTKYGGWMGPGVPNGDSPMDYVLLKDYAPKSSVVTKRSFVPKAKFPVIDFHSHDDFMVKKIPNFVEKWVEIQQEVGVEKTNVLARAVGSRFDELTKKYLEKYPDQFILSCGIYQGDHRKAGFDKNAVHELERCFKNGARGIGELTDKGYGLTGDPKLSPDERLHPDDPKLFDFFEKAGELGMTVSLHVSDHPSAWQPVGVFQERTPIFQQYNKYEKGGLTYEQLLERLIKTIELHPRTNFVACHIANLGNDFNRIGRLLDSHQNMYVDISARDYELGRQPRGSLRFLEKYKNRILFGTDMGIEKTMYQSWWRLLETEDEDMEGRIWWRYICLNLPNDILSHIYSINARRLLKLS